VKRVEYDSERFVVVFVVDDDDEEEEEDVESKDFNVVMDDER
jgi:hypothetical protein